MHNNFYFLRQLVVALEKRLKGTVMSECFSQNKDELITRFETASKPFLIKASFSPDFSALSFPEEFHRARKNSIDLFGSIIGRKVLGLRQFENERSFAIQFTDDFQLLFKMHGNRSNIIALENNSAVELFKSQIVADEAIDLNTLDRKIDWSFEHFIACRSNLTACYFTFGKLPWRYLRSRGFEQASVETQWQMITDVKTLLEKPTIQITEIDSQLFLTLVPVGKILRTYDDPIDASNEFFQHYVERSAFLREKQNLIQRTTTALSASQNFLIKTKEKLRTVEHENNFKVWADLLMANLHRIPPHAESVTLENFYDNNKPTEIRIKRDLSAQKNAEVFYRKSKNQQTEIDLLTKKLEEKSREIEKLKVWLHEIDQADGLQTLRSFSRDHAVPEKKKDIVSLPFHEFEFKGFKILVGRNAQANDELTLKFSYKDDLWLHAKDVAGSHVLIKYQSGKPFPKDVIERAAELAAFHSKRKTESLCPVTVTPKKFVRKRKGDPAGMVVVEREDVVMVVPKA